jgi:TrmH family RNA methyltransferase
MQEYPSQYGIVFGCERTGLENKDIARCHGIIEIPCNPDFSSLNLAQAVNVIAYQVFMTLKPKELENNARILAPADQMHALQKRLEEELEQRSFFRTPEMKPKLVDNIRMLLNRTQMDAQEVQIMHGIISALIGNKDSDSG